MTEAGDHQVAFARQLGQVEGRLSALEQKLQLLEQRIEQRLTAIDSKLEQLTAALNIGRGGWAALAMVGAVLGAIISLIVWVFDHWRRWA